MIQVTTSDQGNNWNNCTNLLIEVLLFRFFRRNKWKKYGVTKAYVEQIFGGKLRKLLYLEVTASIAP